MTFAAWLAFAATAALLIPSPGQTVLYVIGHTLAHGTRDAVPMALGVMTGNAVAMTVCFAGLGALLAANPALFAGLRWLGAAYLVFLAIRLFRRSTRIDLAAAAAGTGRPFTKTFLLMVLNPNALTFFIALAPQFVDPARPVLPQFAAMEATFVLFSGINVLFYSLATNALRRRIANPRALAWLNRAAALSLMVVALLAVLPR